MKQGADQLADVETAIEYRFSNRSLLMEALTHRSFRNESTSASDNERLEFFGDAVLSFCISRKLLEKLPESSEGTLSKIRSSLVDEKTLASRAAALGLGHSLRLGKGEERSGGRTRESLLADAFEALLAAVYLDGGMEPAECLVEKVFSPLFRDLSRHVAGRDAKTEFQELVQSRFGVAPSYRVKSTLGPDHAREFVVGVSVGEEELAEGRGGSKKRAEQEAAARALARLGAEPGPEKREG